jgi:hypothetical protein
MKKKATEKSKSNQIYISFLYFATIINLYPENWSFIVGAGVV